MADGAGRPLIVHISADYPDAVKPTKTRAIAALLEGTADRFDHRVYSLNRRGGWRGWLARGRVEVVADHGAVASMRYLAPARGVFLETSMRRVGHAVARDVLGRRLSPALVVGHKLSFEGIAVRAAAQALRIPFALTLQGNTDQRVIGTRRDLRSAYRRIWREAAAVVAFAPWIARWCAQTLGERAGPVAIVPCVLGSERVLRPVAAPTVVATAFNLDDWRNKNLAALMTACAGVRATVPELRLEIAGGGSPESEAAVDALIAGHGASGFVTRVGRLEPEALQDWMNRAAVFAMPSKRESFGMVFPEALLAGCPIVYPRGAAVDGLFDDCPFALAVDADDPSAIGEALAEAIAGQDRLKAALEEWQRSPAAATFQRASILARYGDILDGARA